MPAEGSSNLVAESAQLAFYSRVVFGIKCFARTRTSASFVFGRVLGVGRKQFAQHESNVAGNGSEPRPFQSFPRFFEQRRRNGNGRVSGFARVSCFFHYCLNRIPLFARRLNKLRC